MSFAKGFLFSCIVMMHVSFAALRPLEEKLRQELEGIEISFCNLLNAEQKYVKVMFPENLSEESYKSLKLPEGITLPLGNAKKIQASICAISDYLENHLPNITRALTDTPEQIINNTKMFHPQLKHAMKAAFTEQCKQREFKTSDRYGLKMKGLGILYYSRQWVERFTNEIISCDK